jgi:hypothetical protein
MYLFQDGCADFSCDGAAKKTGGRRRGVAVGQGADST